MFILYQYTWWSISVHSDLETDNQDNLDSACIVTYYLPFKTKFKKYFL